MFIDTTHVGSLPRGPELVPLLLARDRGQPYDAVAFDRAVGSPKWLPRSTRRSPRVSRLSATASSARSAIRPT